MPGKPKTDIDSYFDQAKPCIGTLIEKQIKKMGSAKIIVTLWVIWKKPRMSVIELDPEDVTNAQDLDDGTAGENCFRVEMSFNSLMTKFFQGSDNNDYLIERILAYIKAQTENLKFPESVFTLDKIMHLYTNFHRLVLT